VRARSLDRALPAFEAGPALWPDFKAALRPKRLSHRTTRQGRTRAQHTSPGQRHTAQRRTRCAPRSAFLPAPSAPVGDRLTRQSRPVPSHPVPCPTAVEPRAAALQQQPWRRSSIRSHCGK
jgi:hypothetical protein